MYNEIVDKSVESWSKGFTHASSFPQPRFSRTHQGGSHARPGADLVTVSPHYCIVTDTTDNTVMPDRSVEGFVFSNTFWATSTFNIL